jgi:hypothetical protein
VNQEDHEDLLTQTSGSGGEKKILTEAEGDFKQDTKKILIDQKTCTSFQTLSQKQGVQLRKNLERRKSQRYEKDKKKT